MNENKIKKITEWIEGIIIKLNLCPFAKGPYENGQINIKVNEEFNDALIVESVLEECEYLTKQEKTKFSNSLLAYPNYSGTFEDFYALVQDCEILHKQVGLSDLFQLVCFHPNFYFADEKNLIKTNLVNQSPYPIIHILKKEEMDKLNLSPSEGEKIANTNKEKLKELSENDYQKLLAIIK